MKCDLCGKEISILAIPHYCLDCAIRECNAALARKEKENQVCATCKDAASPTHTKPCSMCSVRRGYTNNWTPKQ
jgi:hypothetical protein